MVALEVDRQREMATGDVGGHERRRVLVDRRVEEVDEPDAEVLGECGGEVLRADEAAAQQHGGKRLVEPLGLLEGVLEVVA
ncbi:MAG: hypothetical protein KatS3mg010_0615 [Acidimicrobiia bacterium]|nr:MAG: hypothetical protein KatS3mg010_0615 [Acidimicrobiia bacterium]